jgi:hypothetical protein
MIQRARAFMDTTLYRAAIIEAGRAQASDPSRWEAYAVVALCMAKQHKVPEAQKFETVTMSRAPPAQREMLRDVIDREIKDSNQ